MHHRRALPVLWALLVCGSALARGNGEPTEVRYYDVTGNSARELRTAMDRRGPLVAGGRFDAKTTWRVGWSFKFLRAPEGCALRSADVTVAATVLLPRWTHGSAAPLGLVGRWTDYVQALTFHEGGHVQIAREAAAEIRRRAAQFGPRAGCRALAAEMKAMGRQVLDEYRERERRYDDETGHGRTQGARFE